MKILIAPNSFKECADATQIAELFVASLSKRKDYHLFPKPISDGGDGFVKVSEKNFSLAKIKYQLPNYSGKNKIICETGYNQKEKTLYIESAKIIGLNQIPLKDRHPLLLNSAAMGILIKKIIRDIAKGKLQIEKLIIGIGGTGINDLGIGMLSELGLRLVARNGEILKPLPVNFNVVTNIIWKKPTLPFKIELIADVNNPLLGSKGSSYIFGGQKGLTLSEMKIADSGFSNIIKISEREKIIKKVKKISGAGGGLAAGFQLFLNARIMHSDKFIFNKLNINRGTKYNAVITAEGAFDEQSFMNKGTGSIIKKFGGLKTNVFLVCGIIDKKVLKRLPKNVFPIELSSYFKTPKESIIKYKQGIELACREIEKIIDIKTK